MIIQLVPQFNCSPNFWQFWHISTFKGAIPWSQKELQHLPPAGRAVEGEGEGWDANEGGKQGGDAPQGPGAGCRAKGTFSQVQPENDFRSEMHWHFVKIALLDYVCLKYLISQGVREDGRRLSRTWRRGETFSRDFNQLDVKRLEFVSKHKDAACDTFSAPFH